MKTLLMLLLSLCCTALGNDLAGLVQDRAAIERVYYNHRLGAKRPFEEVLTPALIERLVRKDLHRESVLRQAYGVEISDAMLSAEVQRINETTRDPEMLAEIKAALGNDPYKFAQAYAKRFLVEHLLRKEFENDDSLHASQRQGCESVRRELLTAKMNGATSVELLALLWQPHSNDVTEITWQLGPRPAELNTLSADELEIRKRFGPDVQILASPSGGELDPTCYFEDLPPELQKVLRIQLNQAGDVSAVIEAPRGFLLYVCRARTQDKLAAACLSLPKRGYEEWLNEQDGDAP